VNRQRKGDDGTGTGHVIPYDLPKGRKDPCSKEKKKKRKENRKKKKKRDQKPIRRTLQARQGTPDQPCRTL